MAAGGSGGGGGDHASPLAVSMRSPDGREGDGEGGEEAEGGGSETRRRRISGSRWVVMNESGCMLERSSGKVSRAASVPCGCGYLGEG